MIEEYIIIFGTKPSHGVTPPLEKGDHPERDNSDYFDSNGIAEYQSTI